MRMKLLLVLFGLIVFAIGIFAAVSPTDQTSGVPNTQCQTLWWYDSSHQDCQQKEFCGAYMYQSLRTFQTKTECEADLNCPAEQIIMKLSGETNAHGALFSDTKYTTIICYKDIFGVDYLGTAPHTCTNTNKVIELKQNTNSHAAKLDSPYENVVCYGDLECSISQTCSNGKKAVLSVSDELNAHLSKGVVYPFKLCCSSSAGKPPCPDGTTLCTDGTCGIDCTPQGCKGEANEKCEEGEGCGCEDCYGKQDSCIEGAVCNQETKLCELIKECGNNRVDPGEECDGTALPFTECEVNIDLCEGGEVKCLGTCRLDVSSCTGCQEEGTCGDGEINNKYERCDGTNLNGKTCADFDLNGNGLRCYPPTNAENKCTFDTSRCLPAGGCNEGETLCEDGVCRRNCNNDFKCNNNNLCEEGEGCECADCHGYSDSCAENLVCSFKTDRCGPCPAGTSFSGGANKYLGTCTPDAGISIQIIKPEQMQKFKISEEVKFEQKSASSRKDLSIQWEFGDGQKSEIFTDCLTKNRGDTKHTYSASGAKVVKAIASEQGGERRAYAYRDILIYKEGINVFAIITSPAHGELIEDGTDVQFDASGSFVANCTIEQAKCDNAAIAASTTCYNVGPENGKIYCYNLDKQKIGIDYDLKFDWIFDNDKEWRTTRSGTWSENYDDAVKFKLSFFVGGNHTAELKVTYGYYEED